MIWEPCFGGENGDQQPRALFWGLSAGRAGRTASVLAGLESVCIWVWATVSNIRTSRSFWKLERKNRKGVSISSF